MEKKMETVGIIMCIYIYVYLFVGMYIDYIERDI